MTALSTILLIAKEVAEELEKTIKEAQIDNADEARKKHLMNIAQAKALTMRKHIEDALSVEESERKNIEKEMVELEVLRKIQYGEKK